MERRFNKENPEEERNFERKPRQSYGNRDYHERKGSFSDRQRRDDKFSRPKRRFNDEEDGERSFRPKKRFNDDEKRSFRPKRRFNDDDDKSFRPKRRFNDDNEKSFRPKRRFNDNDDKSFRPKRRFNDDDEKSFRPKRRFNDDRDDRPRRGRGHSEEKRPRRRDITGESEILTEIVNRRKAEGRTTPQRQRITSLEYEEQHGPIRLNKYIANAGICSRREADVLIASGAITVNGEVITEMGHKVMPTDEVRYGDRVLQREKPVYVLLNKPKDYITTTDDEFGRPHVTELVRNACEERIYPVGRLDRDTTGLLLLTNDGDLTTKLTHPSSQIEKTYAVELDRNFAPIDMAALKNGLELNDGVIIPDAVEFFDEDKRHVGITIHSGKNRIVRRIFDFLGYNVEKLDRVVFAGLTKKNLPRGEWRFLTKQEVAFLKMLTSPKKLEEQESKHEDVEFDNDFQTEE